MLMLAGIQGTVAAGNGQPHRTDHRVHFFFLSFCQYASCHQGSELPEANQLSRRANVVMQTLINTSQPACRANEWRGTCRRASSSRASTLHDKFRHSGNANAASLCVCRFEARRESIVIEGVHLAPNAVMRLMTKHSSVVPFLVYIRYRCA